MMEVIKVKKQDYSSEHQQLLRDLKITVEGLLVSQVANVWTIYGGLNRLHSAVEKIFLHCCRKSNDNRLDYYNFIKALEWLQPENSNSYFSVDCEYKSHLPPHLKNDKASTWLYRSIESHSLSKKLSWLLSDKSHLYDCYYDYAFLCQEEYAEAVLICLRAVERNEPSLMSEINPCLFVIKIDYDGESQKAHRRCSSFPDHHLKHLQDDRKRSKTVGAMYASAKKNVSKVFMNSQKIQGKLKPWHSMPDLRKNVCNLAINKAVSQCKTTPSTPVHSKKINKISPSALIVDYNNTRENKKYKKSSLKKSSVKKVTKEVKHVAIDNSDIVEYTPPPSTSHRNSNNVLIPGSSTNSSEKLSRSKSPVVTYSPRSVMDYSFLPKSGEKDYNRKPKKTFIEDGGMSVLPMATGYFPKAKKGQSLFSYLTSSHFSRTSAELDRENAHFRISEAIISAMEQIKCRTQEHLAEEQLDESDPEIMEFKQRIRLRRRQKFIEKYRARALASSLLSDGKTDTTSISPESSTSDTVTDESSDDVEDLCVDIFAEIEGESKLEDKRGLSMSMASLFSAADLKRPREPPDGASDVLSAEGLALSIISKFSEKQLPKASDLVWLVSEEDAPQALLPLPKSVPINPDDFEDTATSLRGTHDWAPPRPQIIFTLHPRISRKEMLINQNYRCASCSTKVAIQYSSTFRYCNYLGRYFCTKCHTNQLALIPSRIIQKWDFSRYLVSTFSYRLLEQMYTDPLFPVFDLNKNIGKESKALLFCKKYRLGLVYLKDFIFSCKNTEMIRKRLETEMSYALSQPDMYSIEDLVSIKSGEMKTKLLSLVDICCRHTLQCKYCLGRGFFCEICRSDEVIFPWQLSTVMRCDKCFACFHLKCWNKSKTPCLKCDRLERRQSSIPGGSNIK